MSQRALYTHTQYTHTLTHTPCCTVAAVHTCYSTISGCHGISSGHPREQAFSQGYQYAVGLGNHAWHKAYTAQRYLHNIITTGHKAHIRGHMRAHNNNITPHTTVPVSSRKWPATHYMLPPPPRLLMHFVWHTHCVTISSLRVVVGRSSAVARSSLSFAMSA